MGTSKQDRQGARSVADLERKYNFESFADAYNIATDARNTAEEAKKTATEAKENPNIDHEAVFNALTEDGKCQGLYRDPATGNIYINAEYIKTGVFVGADDVFLEPGRPEYTKIERHMEGWEEIPEAEIPLYDFDGDGAVTGYDLELCRQSIYDGKPLPDFPGKEKSSVRVEIDVHNPIKTISYTATNMWGRVLDYSMGINNEVFVDDGFGGLYREIDGEKEWLNPPVGGYAGMPDEEIFRTIERSWGSDPIYKRMNQDPEGNIGEVEYSYTGEENGEWYPVYHRDGIVETWTEDVVDSLGNSGTWTIRKWHSGLMECWMRYYVSGLNASKTSGFGVYYNSASIPLPSGFTSITNHTCSGSSTAYINWVSNGYANTSDVAWWIICMQSTQTNVALHVNVSVKGRWK